MDTSMFDVADIKTSCTELGRERSALKDQRIALETAIVASRSSDQVVGYVAGFLPPLWLTLDDHTDQKERIVQIQERLDLLAQLARFKKCSRDSANAPESSFETELDRLDSLKAQGKLSDEEYSTLRQGVLRKYYPTADL
jgi:hypothetical protein